MTVESTLIPSGVGLNLLPFARSQRLKTAAFSSRLVLGGFCLVQPQSFGGVQCNNSGVLDRDFDVAIAKRLNPLPNYPQPAIVWKKII